MRNSISEVQLTLSISNSQGTREFVRDRENSRQREKNRLQPTQRDRDFSSRQRKVRDRECSRQRESTVNGRKYSKQRPLPHRND